MPQGTAVEHLIEDTSLMRAVTHTHSVRTYLEMCTGLPPHCCSLDVLGGVGYEYAPTTWALVRTVVLLCSGHLWASLDTWPKYLGIIWECPVFILLALLSASVWGKHDKLCDRKCLVVNCFHTVTPGRCS